MSDGERLGRQARHSQAGRGERQRGGRRFLLDWECFLVSCACRLRCVYHTVHCIIYLEHQQRLQPTSFGSGFLFASRQHRHGEGCRENDAACVGDDCLHPFERYMFCVRMDMVHTRARAHTAVHSFVRSLVRNTAPGKSEAQAATSQSTSSTPSVLRSTRTRRSVHVQSSAHIDDSNGVTMHTNKRTSHIISNTDGRKRVTDTLISAHE